MTQGKPGQAQDSTGTPIRDVAMEAVGDAIGTLRHIEEDARHRRLALEGLVFHVEYQEGPKGTPEATQGRVGEAGTTPGVDRWDRTRPGPLRSWTICWCGRPTDHEHYGNAITVSVPLTPEEPVRYSPGFDGEMVIDSGGDYVLFEDLDPTAGTCPACHEVAHDGDCPRVGDGRPVETTAGLALDDWARRIGGEDVPWVKRS